MAILSKNPFRGRNDEVMADVLIQFKPEVFTWLNEPIQELVKDYFAIRNSHNEFGVAGLSDYSYLVTPAFKALEGFLIQVGEKLGLKSDQYNFRVCVVFSDENLEKFYADVLDKLSRVAEEHRDDIKMWLNDARRILRHYRHSPAHFLGEPKKNWGEAFSVGDNIIRIIAEMGYSIISSGMLAKG